VIGVVVIVVIIARKIVDSTRRVVAREFANRRASSSPTFGNV
jgi:hypothetical protein